MYIFLFFLFYPDFKKKKKLSVLSTTAIALSGVIQWEDHRL